MGKIFSVEFLIQSIPQIAVYLPITLLITIASCVAGLIVGSLLRWPVILKYGYLRQLRKYTYHLSVVRRLWYSWCLCITESRYCFV